MTTSAMVECKFTVVSLTLPTVSARVWQCILITSSSMDGNRDTTHEHI